MDPQKSIFWCNELRFFMMYLAILKFFQSSFRLHLFCLLSSVMSVDDVDDDGVDLGRSDP